MAIRKSTEFLDAVAAILPDGPHHATEQDVFQWLSQFTNITVTAEEVAGRRVVNMDYSFSSMIPELRTLLQANTAVTDAKRASLKALLDEIEVAFHSPAPTGIQYDTPQETGNEVPEDQRALDILDNALDVALCGTMTFEPNAEEPPDYFGILQEMLAVLFPDPHEMAMFVRKSITSAGIDGESDEPSEMRRQLKGLAGALRDTIDSTDKGDQAFKSDMQSTLRNFLCDLNLADAPPTQVAGGNGNIVRFPMRSPQQERT